MELFNLNGKVAIITGVNKGLGQAYTVALAEAGDDIYVSSRSKDGWEETKRLVER